ncbi:MAG TPA: homoserine kinase [Polyangia bacterium]|jgi:homoserine kinase type II
MTSAGPLGAEDIGAALAPFGAGPARAISAPLSGSVNVGYRVETDAGPLFLRINVGKTETEVGAEVALIEHLIAAGVPTPRPWRARDGRGFAWHGGLLVSLFDWAAGRIIGRGEIRPEHAEQVGAALARLHLGGAGVTGPGAGRYTFEEILGRMRGLAGCADPAVAAALPVLWDEAAWLPVHRRRDLPAGLIHQDLFRDNVLFDRDRLAALLDFEQACGGTLGYDLAVALLDWCFDGAFLASRAQALCRGYDAVRPLGAAERAGLYAEARAAALRFTVTRITDVHLPGLSLPTPEGPRKDFRRYLARLEALRAAGPAGFAALTAGGPG